MLGFVLDEIRAIITDFEKKGDVLYIHGLPKKSPTHLFPVIKIECSEKPATNQWGKERLWDGDPERIAVWASGHGNDINVKH